MLLFVPGTTSFVAVSSYGSYPILPASMTPPVSRFTTIFPDSRALLWSLSPWLHPFVLPSCDSKFGPAQFLSLLNHLVEHDKILLLSIPAFDS
jgi:hypothetical protein